MNGLHLLPTQQITHLLPIEPRYRGHHFGETQQLQGLVPLHDGGSGGAAAGHPGQLDGPLGQQQSVAKGLVRPHVHQPDLLAVQRQINGLQPPLQHHAQSREWLARLGAGLKHLAPAHVQQVHVRSRKLQSGR